MPADATTTRRRAPAKRKATPKPAAALVEVTETVPTAAAAGKKPRKAAAQPIAIKRVLPLETASVPDPEPEAKSRGRLAPLGDRLLARLRTEKAVTAQDIIRGIEKGPQGPDTIAAFDFDGTLLGGLSGAMLMAERIRRKDVKRAELADNISSTFKTITKRMEGHELVTRGFTHWAGKTEAEMDELATHLFEAKIQDAIFPEMREIMEAHRKAGHTIVVATAATRYQVERMVAALGVDHLLCTQVEVVDGKLTGKVVGESLFGAGKAEALKRFITERGGDFVDAHFYADGDEEVGLMERVGHPHPVNPSRKLTEASRIRGWPVLRLQSRAGGKPGNYLRGVAGLLSIMPIAQVGLIVGLISRDRRQFSNLVMPTWIQAQLDLAGVKLRVSGRINLLARRPAVFLFNHRNNYDGMFAAVLIRTDVAGIGKKEIGQNPIGKLGTLVTPTVLVERGTGDPKKAAEMLQPLVEAVEKGYSIMLSPEGTRTRGHHNSVGPFKKGAFHMAMAAGIPIVPIVIRNALDVASRDGPLRPGTVDVAVLPPMPVDDWTRENMAEKIESVRQLFIDTLNDWPEPDDEED